MNVRPTLICSACLLFGAASLLNGCQAEDEIRRYQVPRLDQPARLLGAVAVRPKQTWFFKLVGPVSAVNDVEKEFDQFIRSLRFTDDEKEPVQWTLPAGWSNIPSSERLRFATFKLGLKDAPLELTVTPLGGEAGSLLANVNRWRRQMGLADIAEAELGDVTRPTEVNGQKITRVDMKGSGSAQPVPPPIARGPEAAPKVKYQAPPGWKESARQVPFSVATLEVSDGGAQALVTVSPLARQAGSLTDNVLRWRQQIGLEPADEEQIRKDTKPIAVNGNPGHYVDLTGPGGARPAQRILGVVVPSGDRTWFIKMTGPADLVAKQKDAFEAFVKSIQFE